MVKRRDLFKGLVALVGVLCLPFKAEPRKTFWEGTTIPRSVSLEEARRRVEAYFPQREIPTLEVGDSWLKMTSVKF